MARAGGTEVKTRRGGKGRMGATGGGRSTQPSHDTHTTHQVHRPSASRLHPDHPIVSVGAVVLDGDRVLLIKRAHEPLKGAWSLPGGVVELGETLREALAREVLEETGLEVEVGQVLEVVDRVQRDDDGRVEFHFVILDYSCRLRGGALSSGSDADDARWVSRSQLLTYTLTASLRAVIAKAFATTR
jgi:ADP-ribose pyrophosphatase YjhB (NUDIX family)